MWGCMLKRNRAVWCNPTLIWPMWMLTQSYQQSPLCNPHHPWVGFFPTGTCQRQLVNQTGKTHLILRCLCLWCGQRGVLHIFKAMHVRKSTSKGNLQQCPVFQMQSEQSTSTHFALRVLQEDAFVFINRNTFLLWKCANHGQCPDDFDKYSGKMKGCASRKIRAGAAMLGESFPFKMFAMSSWKHSIKERV